MWHMKANVAYDESEFDWRFGEKQRGCMCDWKLRMYDRERYKDERIESECIVYLEYSSRVFRVAFRESIMFQASKSNFSSIFKYLKILFCEL